MGEEEKSWRVEGDAARRDKTHTKTSLSCGRGVAVSMTALTSLCWQTVLFHFLAYPIFTLTLFIRSHSTQHQTSLCGCLATTSVSHTPGFKQETYYTPAPRRPEESTVAR